MSEKNNERPKEPMANRPPVMRPAGRPGGFGGGPRGGMFMAKAKAKDIKGTLIRLWGYLSRRKRKLIGVFSLVILSSLLMLTGPMLIGMAIDNYIVPGDFDGLLRMIIIMMVIYVFSAAASWLQSYTMTRVSQDTVADIRNDVFSRLQILPLRFFDSKTHGELMSRVTNDIENISHTLNQSTTQVFSSVITVIGTLAAMLWLSPLLTLLSLIIIPFMTLTTGKIAGKTRNYFSGQQERLGELNGFIEETITGQKAVKSFTREKMVMKDFEEASIKLKEVGTKAQIFSGVIGPIMNVINNFGFAILAGAGGYLAVQGIITVGVIASFLNYSRQFMRPINEMANQFNMVQSAIAGAERVFEVMDESPELLDEADAYTLKEVKGNVAFDDVTFGYNEAEPVLKDINITVKPGQTIALVGPTGAGKTTIVNLLTRFYDIDKGAILIDGRDIRTIKRDSLRSSLGIVLQDTHLFSETVRENIRYGRLDATDEEVEEAARLANAEHFILRLPDGYDTLLTEDGGNLSQGQRQLLSIARAILLDPAILILDEATSSVDTRTELHIQEAMLNLMKGRTSFVIAHRLSTIRDADMILVINDGRIIEKGSHDELLELKGFYHNLYMNQFRRQAS
ncbi:putative ABC transporter ATP-binding protein [Oxobacter pfennigii]|uniref:Putative ABC transporter ATP-binding protein n=1 Tax=Oxobacter pfennigii TaxID=36849 RepID=A0A0P8WC63_9CLOT|nr:ABC transporter ATP-binding protein [Oxobacter pfennigii]KPU45489.1 putative ABC transporter ATP-binding protein [Oxobacter pfennigii]